MSSSFFNDLAGIAETAISQRVRASVKTNLGPEIPIYDGATADQPGLAAALGIKAALIIRDGKTGATIAQYGEPPPTNYALAAGLALAVVAIGFVAFQTVRRL